jgi:cell division protein FtsB
MDNRRKWLWASVTIAFVLAAWSASAEGGFRRYMSLSTQVDTLRARNQRSAEENAKLLKEVEALRSDPKAIERAAREELGFIRPGEVVIQLEERPNK